MKSHDETLQRGNGGGEWVSIGSFSSSKLSRTLRSQHSEVSFSGPESSRPQTLNKSSSVDETVIRKIFVPHRKKEEIYSVGRRITRAMDGGKGGSLLQSPKSTMFEPLKKGMSSTSKKYRKEKSQIITSNKAGNTGSREEGQMEKPVKNAKFTKQTLAEDRTETSKVDAPSPRDVVSNHRLTRLDVVKIKVLQENGRNEFDHSEKNLLELKQKLREPGTLEEILGKTTAPAAGVITRGKAIVKDNGIEVDEKRPSLVKTKNTVTGHYAEIAEVEAAQSLQCSIIPRMEDSFRIHDDKKQRKRDSGESIEKQENGCDKCVYHVAHIGPPISRKRGRPPGSKKKSQHEISVAAKGTDVPQKRVRVSLKEASSRIKHRSLHDAVAGLSVIVEKGVTKRGKSRGALLTTAGKRQSSTKTGEMGIVTPEVDILEPTVEFKQASPQVKAVLGIFRKRGRPCGTSRRGRGRCKNTVTILQTSKGSKKYTDAVVVAKNMGVLRKRGRPRGALSRVGSRLKDSLMSGNEISLEMQGMLKDGVRKTVGNVFSDIKLSKSSLGLLRKRGRPHMGSIRGRGRWKGSLVAKECIDLCKNAGDVEETRPQTEVQRKRGRPCGGSAEGKRDFSLSKNSVNDGFLSLKRRKRIRMMNVLGDSLEMLEHEDVRCSKRRKMVATVTKTNGSRRKIKTNIMEKGTEDKTNRSICSLNFVAADDLEFKLVKAKNMFGLETCNGWPDSEENNMEADDVGTPSKIADDAIEVRKGIVNVDFGSQLYLVATSPMGTGGRQMRPRPLDLRQPLITLIEGRDQEYYEFDGGAFFRMLQQQIEPINLSMEKMKQRKSISVAACNAAAKETTILLPTFRTRRESEEHMRMSWVPYVVPETYIRVKHEENDNQVDYDIDEEDEEWLNEYNQTMSPSRPLTADQFENIIDLLENKAATFNCGTSAIEHLEEEQKSFPEECCICNGGENAEHNLVFRCSACYILVHQSCYGIQESIIHGKENWHCRKCEAVFQGKENADISCALCCKKGGALKPAMEPHKWAHVVCALYTNETYFVNPDAMEPIDGLSAANMRAKRQRRQCWLCGMKEGSVERCSVQGCKALFHVSCGVLQGASFELQHFNHQVISVRIFCPAHAILISNTNEELPSFGNNDCIVMNLNSNVNNVPKRRGRRRKGRIQKKNLFGKGKMQTSSVNLECNSVDQESKIFMNRNVEESVVHSAKRENVMADTVIRQVSAILKVDQMGERDNISELIDRIYLYWISKREKYGGALLHRLQQELAAKKFGIFNSVEDSLGDRNMTAAKGRHEVEKLEELANLVAEHEKLKVDIQLISQDILRVTGEFLKARGSSGTCVECKGTGLQAICTSCSRSGCFYCTMVKRGFTCDSDWLASLKKFVCGSCFEQSQTRRNSGFLVDRDNIVISPSSMVSTSNQMLGERSIRSAQRKPYMLLPRLDYMHQNRLATEVFWQQSHRKRTIPIVNLLRMPKVPKPSCASS